MLTLRPAKYHCYILLACFLLVAPNLFAQAPDTSGQWLLNKMDLYKAAKSQNVIFGHFDKTVYTKEENVWFTAYLLKKANPDYLPHVLHAVLINNDLNNIVFTANFLMDRGIAFGNIFLPDSIAAGAYSFVLYAGPFRDGRPAGIFIQPVIINATQRSGYSVRLDLDTSASNSANIRVVATIAYKGTKKRALTYSYLLGNAASPVIVGADKTIKTNSYSIEIPIDKIHSGNNMLHVSTNVDGRKITSNVLLPLKHAKFSVDFYPEGGSLVFGLMSKVGFEVKNTEGNPIRASLVVYDNDKIIDTVNSDVNGMGFFFARPQMAHHYCVKIISAGTEGAAFNLPEPLANGSLIAIRHSITDDTLSFTLSAAATGKHFIMVHNFENVYSFQPVQVGPERKLMRLVLNQVPRGLAEITLMDSLYRPCAERLFFAHFNKSPHIVVTTDKLTYYKRQKVQVTLKLNSPFGGDDRALLSVACVESRRIEPKNKQDIVSATYLKSEISDVPFNNNWMSGDDNDIEKFENLLLIRGWRRYTWPELVRTMANDTSGKLVKPEFSGNMTYDGKKLKKTGTIVIIGDSAIRTINTNPDGKFQLSYDNLLVQQDKKLQLFSAGADPESFNITVDDPFKQIDNAFSKEYNARVFTGIPASQIDDMVLSGFEHNIMLGEVVIKGQSELPSLTPYNANPCGDYVCTNNILNCALHRNNKANTKPVTGGRYLVFDLETQKVKTVVYEGCNTVQYNHSIAINGVYFSKEFYPVDYTAFNPGEPEYLSTIYWRHLLNIDVDKTVIFNFYTSDVTGPFKIIVQGVTGNDVVYAEKDIAVR